MVQGRHESRVANADSFLRNSQTSFFRQITHPHIVPILGMVDNRAEKEVWIITELMDSSIRPYCTGDKQDKMSNAQKMIVAVHCWSALCYLHTYKITHKDIKPENIMVTNPLYLNF